MGTVAERCIYTLKENVLWVRSFETIEELRQAVLTFKRTYRKTLRRGREAHLEQNTSVLCALRWVYRNAEQHNFDLDKLVVTGNSAGGHLALTTGMLPGSAGLDRQCPGNRRRTWSTGTTSTEELKVAAIINWYGITDVVDLIERAPGASGSFTEAWLGSSTDREEVARRVSPLTYVRQGLPPILTIHGDADPIVPYSHGVRLHQALEEARVPNELVTVSGGGHGGFTDAESARIYTAIRDFLNTHGVLKGASN